MGNNDTTAILYSFLRLLQVKVSRATVQRLLDTPVGNSMRGISDALDELHVKNAVYQLPSPDYFNQLQPPFITLLDKDSAFCLVTKNTGTIVEFEDTQGLSKHETIPDFLTHWTGVVLVGEPTNKVPADNYRILKDVGYFLGNHLWAIAVCLLLSLGYISLSVRNAELIDYVYLTTLCCGIFISVIIIYKESINSRFLNRFCHIGERINCNKVLHSKGANIMGASLGELALTYFFCALCIFISLLGEHIPYSCLLCIVACIFSIYSVIYQAFVLRQGCLLCILIDIVIWAQAGILICTNKTFTITTTSLLSFSIIGMVSIVFLVLLKRILKLQHAYKAQEMRMSSLYNVAAFSQLLQTTPSIHQMPKDGIAMRNNMEDGKRLLIVTNPNCANCASSFPTLKKLSEYIPISLIFTTFAHDAQGNNVVKVILSAYRKDGWEVALRLLEEWFDKKRIKGQDKYHIDKDVETLWKEQLIYCWQQRINKTPVALVEGHFVPEVYRLSDMRYVLT